MSRPEILIPSEFSRLLDDDWREAIVEGGRYSLKSHTVARVALVRAIRQKYRVLCGREFQNSINESVHQLLADLINYYQLSMFDITRDSIINRLNGSDFIFKGVRHNAQSIKSIEGIDLFWGEEAQTFSKDSIDIITPTIRKPGSRLIWTMNRFTELDPIYERLVIRQMPNTLHIKANYDIAEKYDLLPKEIKTEIEHDKENNPELYAHKWLGEPISQSELSVLGRTMVLGSMQRNNEGDGQIEVGVDVARMGDDRTVFWKRKGLKTLEFKTFQKLRTTQVCDALEMFVDFNKETMIKIDDTGVGGGVTDEMIKRGYTIAAINFGGMPNDKDKYPNWISEAWFSMIDILPEAELPMDSDLLMELTTRQWIQDNKGKRRVESKADYKKRGFRSPDLADACIICYSRPYVPNLLEYYKQTLTDKKTETPT